MKLSLSLILLVVALPCASDAAIIINATETGGDVVFDFSGTANTTGLSPTPSGTPPSQIVPSAPEIIFGGSSAEFYAASAGSAFGSGGITSASSVSGDAFGLGPGLLFLPTSYSSGTSISGSMTFAGHSFASLEVTPGSYSWTFNSGPNLDSATLNVIASSGGTPEPSTAALLALGVVGLVSRRRFRQLSTAGS